VEPHCQIPGHTQPTDSKMNAPPDLEISMLRAADRVATVGPSLATWCLGHQTHRADRSGISEPCMARQATMCLSEGRFATSSQCDALASDFGHVALESSRRKNDIVAQEVADSLPIE